MAVWRFSAACAIALLRLAAAEPGGLRGGVDATSGAPLRDEAELLGSALEASQSLEALARELADNASEDLGAATWELLGNESALAEDSEDPALEKSSPWRRGHIMTLYHTTSPAAASAILSSGFRPGHSGWCGGGIYFVATPVLPPTKYGPTTQSGAVIQARVDMGRMTTMDRYCRSWFGTGIRSAARRGFDSVRFDPGDGAEYVIWSNSRVLSMRRYK